MIYSEFNVFSIEGVEKIFEGTDGNLWGSISRKRLKKYGLKFF